MSVASADIRGNIQSDASANSMLDQVIAFWASLKLTVILFALALLLVLVGTLAQDEENMLEVKRQYFNSFIAYVPFDVFVPQPFAPHSEPLLTFRFGEDEFGEERVLTLGFPMPGGALLGILLMINLIAAKIKRFRVSASGGRLLWGLGLAFVGIGLTTLVIFGGHSSDGLQGDAPIEYDQFWQLTIWGTGLIAIALVAAAFYQPNRLRRVTVGCIAAMFLAGAVVMLMMQERPGDPSLRILWQLLESGLAGLPLLLGFILVFGARGGNALVHYGIALLMLGQFIFGDRQLEQKLVLTEGQATNVLRNTDKVELAVIDRSSPEEDQVVAIPAAALVESLDNEQPINDDRLPFEIEVLDYFPNSMLQSAKESEPRASTGLGQQYNAVERPTFSGANPATDLASAYVELRSRDSGEPLGTYLVSQYFSDWQMLARRSGEPEEYDTVAVDGKTYDIGLRFQRQPKPFWVRLEDVRRMTYSGTMTPRDFSSFVHIVDEETGETRRERIWMNNPLRYRGETFYQSEYYALDDGSEKTVLQVVENAGWKIPYVCCVLVGMGLVTHFSGTMVRFLNRMDRDVTRGTLEQRSTLTPLLACGVTSVLFLAVLTPREWITPPKGSSEGPEGMNFYEAGTIPVQFGGRVMPLDAYARLTLQAVSNKTVVYLTEEQEERLEERVGDDKMPALQWLFEVAAGTDEYEDYQIFRIDSSEVLSELGLIRKEGNRYSLAEIRENIDAFNASVQQARELQEKDESLLTFKQAKMTELDNRIRAFTLMAASFERLAIPPIPTREQLQENPNEAAQQFAQLRALVGRMDELRSMSAPAVLPEEYDVATEGAAPERWLTYAAAQLNSALSEVLPENAVPPTLETFDDIVLAYKSENGEAFNIAVRKHIAATQATGSPAVAQAALRTERWLEGKNPFIVAQVLYIICAVVTLFSLVFYRREVRPIIFGVLCATLVIHTIALAARIYVTGRPPVINLYSSAIFIGWSIVIAGLVIELLYRSSLGNLVAGIAGGSTLMVAYGLYSGDTMPVLQAVLDTQFWLGTHVITVALGYSATFLAGLLGLIWVGARLIRGNQAGANDKWLYDIYRMMYGTVCFAILFSFVGTVLGGLWADDSWGRFWGWDPKENGALMIVIWNVLMLHARWDRWVGQRGFALLAMGGNLVTAWSWFGTNQLGLGLHAYGGNSGAQIALVIFALTQLAVIIAGYFLTRPVGESDPRPT